MSIVRINAIEVPEGMGEMLEQRFAASAGNVNSAPGFEGFELLRPTGEAENRYFVVTHWESVEAFDAWVASEAFGKSHGASGKGAPQAAPAEGTHGHGHGHGHGGGHGHGEGHAGPVGTGSQVLEFDVVLQSGPKA